MATSRVHRLSNWDRTCINLPFGRMGVVRGAEIRVPRNADEATLEAARLEVENALNTVTERAYGLARVGFPHLRRPEVFKGSHHAAAVGTERGGDDPVPMLQRWAHGLSPNP